MSQEGSKTTEIEHNFQERAKRLERVRELPTLAMEVGTPNDIKERQFLVKDFTFQKEADKVQPYYRGKKVVGQEIRGKFLEAKVGQDSLPVVFAPDYKQHAAYLPSRDMLLIGPACMQEAMTDEKLFATSLGHEMGHMRYFHLPEKEQTQLNDTFIKFDSLNKLLRKFAHALYTFSNNEYPQAGAGYLKTHEMSSIQELVTPAGINEPGIKDRRSLKFELDGQSKEVSLALLVTEMLSYMSGIEVGEDNFDKVCDKSKGKRGGVPDPRYDVVYAANKYIRANPLIEKQIRATGVWKDTDPEVVNMFSDKVKEFKKSDQKF